MNATHDENFGPAILPVLAIVLVVTLVSLAVQAKPL